MKISTLIDLQYGDSGKGKISKILNDKYKYDCIAKYNGGGNAGHAVYINDKKYTAHYLTSGVYGKHTKIVIGPGCVLNVNEFLKEYELFNSEFNLDGRVFIHPYVNIINDKHIEEDSKDTIIGTTKKGIGQCYSDKYKRTNIRAGEVRELSDFMLNIDSVKDFSKFTQNCLMEGSQGWWLDIDHGRYPYVTSSHIHPAFAFTTFGIPIDNHHKTYGVAKIYETYVGNYDDMLVMDDDKIESRIREIGKEYGETTGRARRIGYLNMNRLMTAITQTGISELFINKIDVLDEVKIFKFVLNGEIVEYKSIEGMITVIDELIYKHNPNIKIYVSGNPTGNDIHYS